MLDCMVLTLNSIPRHITLGVAAASQIMKSSIHPHIHILVFMFAASWHQRSVCLSPSHRWWIFVRTVSVWAAGNNSHTAMRSLLNRLKSLKICHHHLLVTERLWLGGGPWQGCFGSSSIFPTVILWVFSDPPASKQTQCKYVYQDYRS